MGKALSPVIRKRGGGRSRTLCEKSLHGFRNQNEGGKEKKLKRNLPKGRQKKPQLREWEQAEKKVA